MALDARITDIQAGTVAGSGESTSHDCLTVSDRSLRAVGIALALIAGAIHFALSQANLIAGETTATPAFLLMALGFGGSAALVAFARGDLLVLVPVYSAGLIFAWAVTRAQFPIEVFGMVSKLAEAGLAIVGLVLFRRG